MYCKNCGAKIPDGSRFCPKCGTNVPIEEKVVTPDIIIDATGTNCTPPQPSRPSASRPDNYLLWAILVTIFCCIPFGIVAIVYSLKVDSAWDAGLYDTAKEYSRKARSWTIWGAIINVILWIAYFVVIVGILGLGFAMSDLVSI